MIAGLGDCGACSACSLRDAVAFERLGVPATVVITDAFVGHVARFADALGLPGYPALVVPHPVSSKDAEHLARLGRGHGRRRRRAADVIAARPRALAGLTVCVALWGMVFVAVHELLPVMGSVQMVTLRFLLAAGLFAALMASRPQWRPRFSRREWLLCIAAACWRCRARSSRSSKASATSRRRSRR